MHCEIAVRAAVCMFIARELWSGVELSISASLSQGLFQPGQALSCAAIDRRGLGLKAISILYCTSTLVDIIYNF